MALALISFHAKANDDRKLNLVQANNTVSEKRIALVIGNSAYINSPLQNPVNDAKDIAAKLRKQGFEVIERNNLQTKQIGGALREFRSKLVPGAVALVFYAGHGLQIKGENYLPAVDADINSEEDVPNQSLAVKQIMDVLDDSRTRLNLVFLDACRNNPYARNIRSAAGDGLARISAPSGTLISYATRPGSVAADGNGRNGLYTSKLLAQIDSNQQIELALKQVVTDVKTASKGLQEPWMEGSIEGDFCFAGCVASGGQNQKIVPASEKNDTSQRASQPVRDCPDCPAIASVKLWRELTPMQKEALFPLRQDWNKLPKKQQQYFLKLTEQYPDLTPAQKKEFHKRLRSWKEMDATARAEINNRDGIGADQPNQKKAQPGRGNFKVCQPDVKKFCQGVKSGEGRIIACLKDNMSNLLPACAAILPKTSNGQALKRNSEQESSGQ